jgi:hypothetical protein
VEIPLPWERILWRGRAFPRNRYALTDLRVVFFSGARTDEILIQDIGEVHRTTSRIDRLVGTSTLAIHPRDPRRPSLVLRHIRRGTQLGALLSLLAGDPHAALDADAVRATLAWEPRADLAIYHAAFSGLLAVLIVAFVAAIGLRGKAASVAYAPDDAIYPAGDKRSDPEIARFMETAVLPWARDALGPIAGGRDRVTCLTCHGPSARARSWQMPAVAALPTADLADRGWETYGGAMDAQTRNAIYGYTAQADKQTKAAYMREVIMPGMARLLHRPAYDFTKPYDYNRTRAAFGCYHCHQVK